MHKHAHTHTHTLNPMTERAIKMMWQNHSISKLMKCKVIKDLNPEFMCVYASAFSILNLFNE